MRNRLLTVFFCLIFSFVFRAQMTMNIYQSNGVIKQYPVFAIDSITYTTYGSSVTDQNGNVYATIVIGSQEWMAENLRATTYANGDPIPNITEQTQWQNLTIGAWAHYNNDSQYETSYGKLYNAFTVLDTRKICPSGWHVPSEAEWIVLRDYLGGQLVAGGKMKSTEFQYWQGGQGTNQSGFSGLPAGERVLEFAGGKAIWWSSTEYPLSVPGLFGGRYILLPGSNTTAQILGTGKQAGYSVRCVKD